MAAEITIVAIELGSSKITGIAGRQKIDGSINVLAVVCEDSSSFIRHGVVNNIDKTAMCIKGVVNRLGQKLNADITKVYVGVGGQSIRGVRNIIVKEFLQDTKVTQELIDELKDSNRGMKYPDQEILYVSPQEYKLDTQVLLDPVGIQCKRLEGNFLNILQRKKFYKNLNTCFENAGVPIAEMYLAPVVLADNVLTEAERRSGCMLVDLGAETTTIAVFTKNILRHLAVLPLGGNNITKDIAASLGIEEPEAEGMKKKYGCAYTPNDEINTELEYPVTSDKKVLASKFINIVEARVWEIIENVSAQIPAEYLDKLLGGIILTGGAANLKGMDKAFKIRMKIEKVRVAKFVNHTINSSIQLITAKDGTMNTVLSLLAKGQENCTERRIDRPNPFAAETAGEQQSTAGAQPLRNPAGAREGVVPTPADKKKAEEEARLKREEKEREARRIAEEEARRREREENERKKKNSPLHRGLNWFKKLGNTMLSEE